MQIEDNDLYKGFLLSGHEQKSMFSAVAKVERLKQKTEDACLLELREILAEINKICQEE